MLLWDLRENTDRKLPVLCHHTVIICHVWPHKHTALGEPVEITEAQVVVDKMRLPQTDLKRYGLNWEKFLIFLGLVQEVVDHTCYKEQLGFSWL